MTVLVTGGTGVVGEGVIPALLKAGHKVRLLSRGAEPEARRWPDEVEAFAADITDPESLAGSALGCEAIVHITGIVQETPPDITFQRVNVGGTRHVVEEAERSGVRRLIYVSSLGAERGKSAYHQSKFEAERFVRTFPGEWLILRPGNVYGPGDEIISLLLKLTRALPAVPVIGSGDQAFQPIWYEDLGDAVARAVDDNNLNCTVVELAGEDTATLNDILDHFARITQRSPVRVPVPSFVAELGAMAANSSVGRAVADFTGMKLPVNEAQLSMLAEGSMIREPGANGLTAIFGITPTPLAVALEKLADLIPEQAAADGVGGLERKRFWADIHDSSMTAPQLMHAFQNKAASLIPIDFEVEPGAPTKIEEGATLTAALPLRGNIQVRVEEATDHRLTFSTVQGHPLAGAVRFTAEPAGEALHFSVEVHARPANLVDWVAMRTVGGVLQDMNWREVVEGAVKLSEGVAPQGVQTEKRILNDTEARAAEQWMEDLVARRKRDSRGSATEPRP